METSDLLNWLLGAVALVTAGLAALLAHECNCRWQNIWRTLARIPLYVLGSYLAVTAIELIVYQSLGSLWQLELYVWALLAIVYTGSLLTIKHQYNISRDSHAEPNLPTAKI